MPRWLAPLVIALGLVGLLVYQLVAEGSGIQCKVCVSFEGKRECASGAGATREIAVEEAHRSACSRMTSGVTEAFACPREPADAITCGER